MKLKANLQDPLDSLWLLAYGSLSAICLLFFVSCRQRETIPNDILHPEKMEKVLWDMVRADQFVTDYILTRDTLLKADSESIRMYQQIFRIHNISREDFKKSYYFYQTHPDFLKPVVDSIMSRTNTAPTEKVPEKD